MQINWIIRQSPISYFTRQSYYSLLRIFTNMNYLLGACLLFLSIGLNSQPCVGGMSGGYPCSNVDLLAFMNKSSIGGTGSLNDVWGWSDPLTGKEYALVGLTNGTSFIDVTDPSSPIYLGILPTQTFNSSWRDVKVVNDHAFIGSEASGHGVQVVGRLTT